MSKTETKKAIAQMVANAEPFAQWASTSMPNVFPGMPPKKFYVQDPTTLPPRRWLYANRLIRGRLSMTLAPGGLGKSGLTMAEAVDMASGKGFVHKTGNFEPLHVLVWNLEDPDDEMLKRFAAICKHYEVKDAEITDKLFYNTVDESLVITQTDGSGTVIAEPVVAALVDMLKRFRIDVLIIDPFISSHDASENDNAIMDRVAKTWARVALKADCAIELVHHSRKLNGTSVTTDASRGASATTNAARNVRTLNQMSVEEARDASVDNHRRFFKAINDKANLSPPAERADWFQLVSVDLLNGTLGLGDNVGVVESWKWPDASAGLPANAILLAQHTVKGGKYRESYQSPEWAGHAIGEALDIDTSEPPGQRQVKVLMKSWIKNGLLRVISKKLNGRETPFIEVGEWMK